MGLRDREWPGYTQWYCCRLCRRLWTCQGSEVVALGRGHSLGHASPSPGVPERTCFICQGLQSTSLLEI